MNDRQFVRLCKHMDLETLSADERFATNPLRVQHRDVLLEILQDRLDEHTSAEWLELLDGSGLAYGPINTVGEVFDDPQVRRHQPCHFHRGGPAHPPTVVARSRAARAVAEILFGGCGCG